MFSKNKLLSAILLLVCSTVSAQSPTCNIAQIDAAMSGQGFQLLNVQGYPCARYYYNFLPTSSWSTAATQAASVGATLVTIRDQAENDAVWQAGVQANISGGVWIGYTDRVTEGTWRWEDGSTATFTNWNSSEPSNNVDICSSTGEDAAVMQMSNGRWNDVYVDPVFPCLFPPSYRSIVKVNLCPVVTVNNVAVCGGQPAALTASASFGSPAYTYSWNSGQTVAAITVTPSATTDYIVTTTDRYACSALDTATVTVAFSSITLDTSGPLTFCDSGSVTLSVMGSYADYHWSTGDSTATLYVTTAGDFALEAFDSAGCRYVSDTVTVNTSPGNLVIAVDSQHNVSCNGLADGYLAVSASGGVQAYNYLWSTSHNTQAIANLAAGVYTITVTDNNACNTTTQLTITEPVLLTLTIDSIKTPACFGMEDGSISIAADGGTMPYTYSLNGGAFLNDTLFSNLASGNYIIQMRDAAGCTSDSAFNLTSPAELTATYSISNTPLAVNEGGIKANPAGGTAPYEFALDGGSYQQSSSFVDLEAGTYEITVRDANGCILADTVTVEAITGLRGLDKNLLSVYPNPARDFIQVKFVSPAANDYAVLSLRDIRGVTVVQFSATATDIQQGVLINMRTLAEGVYFLHIQCARGVAEVRVMH